MKASSSKHWSPARLDFMRPALVACKHLRTAHKPIAKRKLSTKQRLSTAACRWSDNCFATIEAKS